MRITKHHLIFLFICCFAGTTTQADPISRALKLLGKGKHEKVEDLLKKSQRKYPVNAGAHYVWSRLYFDSTFVRSHLDSSHYHIEKALVHEQTPDSLQQWPLENSKLTPPGSAGYKNIKWTAWPLPVPVV